MIKKLGLLITVIICVTALLYPFIWGTRVADTQPREEQPTVEKPTVPEKPLHNVKLPNFAAIKDVKQKKAAFFDFIREPIEKANAKLRSQRAVLEIALMMTQFDEPLTDVQIDKVTDIFAEYGLGDEQISELSLRQALRKVDVIPKELVMMQAANESAWGTSRFARIGLNFFGQWCFSKGCGMVPKRRNQGAKHEVAVYQSVQEAVNAYFYNINTNSAYRELRDIRADLRQAQQPIDAKALTYGLMSYSERGEAYIEELQAMIDHNRTYFDE
ncbi:glucosaminidase domain-containing protein [Pseudoalteromonas ruthenica]|uniref:glucosaminidase domain-containing protein n=1 Tax=Pseudoalteromonas ruthenica TaxID=151081 RepID=UPI00241CF718|nr:glucosaminidase domain-containing protein [Pseudoalteromonas ruthenica]|tara:strand:- start:63930 stop:64745 length:816 start_codon:yes stop_codon:yes gene_type:complete